MLTTIEKVLFLKSIGIFEQIPGEDLARIAQIAEEVVFEKGTIVFREKDPGDALYLIISGRVNIHIGERNIAKLGDKECFGEMAILDGEPRSASVTALEETVALRIMKEDFYDILSDRIEIAQGIFKVLSKRLRAANVR
jgi:CRP/FNR family cyclic AMP-dependent transcriptional regulator